MFVFNDSKPKFDFTKKDEEFVHPCPRDESCTRDDYHQTGCPRLAADLPIYKAKRAEFERNKFDAVR